MRGSAVAAVQSSANSSNLQFAARDDSSAGSDDAAVTGAFPFCGL